MMLRPPSGYWIAIAAMFVVANPPTLFAFQESDQSSEQKQIVRGADGIFTTRANPVTLPMPEDEEVFQFVIYGDRTGGVPAGLEVLKQAVVDTNLMDPDFVLTVGDLIQGYNRPPEWLAEMREYREIMGRLNMPWFPVAGNHDIYWDSRDPDRPRQHHETSYEKHFGPLWYAFEHKHTGFIVMYSDEGDPETGEKGFQQGRMQMVSPQQIEFLKNALERLKDKQQVFVALHHPRWIGGGYDGGNWPAIHKMLVEAGNVPAVFAGHIHQMRYDPRDGIDYFALATTGGHLGSDLPEVGFLHHFNVVTVRPDGYSMSTVPVGAVMDPKKFAPGFLTDVRRVQNMRPRRAGDRLEMRLDGSAARSYSVAIPNPGAWPLEVTLAPEAGEDWRVVPDHQHLIIPPGKTDGMDFYFYRKGETAAADAAENWNGFQVPSLVMNVDYLHEAARIRLPAVSVPVNIALAERPQDGFATDLRRCLELNTSNGDKKQKDCAVVRSADLNLPQGPFTLEAWIYPTALNGSRAVVAKTQSSEFAIFLHEGVPHFDVHLNGRYVSPKAAEAVPLDRWTHLAGTYDGRQVHLFVNGQRVQSLEGNGDRRQNGLPLFVGADPDGGGNPTRHFAGRIDEVRLSQGTRYRDTFEPARRNETDSGTVLLLHLDRAHGPFLHDDSTSSTSVLRLGDARIAPDDR